MRRESGFYRVLNEGEWTVAQYHSNWNQWCIMGEGGYLEDKDFELIDEARIEMPSHSPEAEPNAYSGPSFN